MNFGMAQYTNVPGPVLFILYSTPLACLIDKYSVHHDSYADGTQLYHSWSERGFDHLIQTLEDCIRCENLGVRKPTETEQQEDWSSQTH